MSGTNVTILQLATTSTNPVVGDRFPAWQTTASQTVQFLASQVTAFAFSTNLVLTGQTTPVIAVAGLLALPTGPVGFLTVTINGSPFKVPYYT